MVIPEVGNDLVAGRVDGTYAVRALLGPASYRVAAASFLTNAGPPSASTYVRTMSGGLRASEHVPAAVSDLQDAYTVSAPDRLAATARPASVRPADGRRH